MLTYVIEFFAASSIIALSVQFSCYLQYAREQQGKVVPATKTCAVAS